MTKLGINIFKQKSECQFGFIQFLNPFNCHNLCIFHGISFTNYFKYPVGSLSESAIEARNKANVSAQAGHASFTSFAENTLNTANYLFMICTFTAKRTKRMKFKS